MVKSYKELLVWQKGMTLVANVYRETASFPRGETRSLIDQMRRAAVSIPSNIAEGFGRKSRAELIRYSQISLGSLYELETQVIIARELHYLPGESHASLDQEISELDAMLQSFIYSLRGSDAIATTPQRGKTRQ